MRIVPPLPVGAEEASVLRHVIATHATGSTPARRAAIVLLAAEGLGPAVIAERLACSRQTVITWRERFRAEGVEGLRDAPRSGRPATVDEAAVIARTLDRPPRPALRWSTRSLAAELGISNAAVANVWRAHGVSPGTVGRVRLGTEPVLDAVIDAVLGLHLGVSVRVLALQVGGLPTTRGPDPGPWSATGSDPHEFVEALAAPPINANQLQ